MEDEFALDSAVGGIIRKLLPKENTSLSVAVEPLAGSAISTRLIATRFSFDSGEIVELTYWSKIKEGALSVTRFMIESDHGLHQCKLKCYTEGCRSDVLQVLGSRELELEYRPIHRDSAPGLASHTLDYLTNTRIINRGIEPRR